MLCFCFLEIALLFLIEIKNLIIDNNYKMYVQMEINLKNSGKKNIMIITAIKSVARKIIEKLILKRKF